MKKIMFILFIIFFVSQLYAGEKHKLEIVSVFKARGLYGSFTLGCGTIGTHEYFYFFIKHNGALHRIRIHSSLVAIYEGYKNPHIVFETGFFNGLHLTIRELKCGQYNGDVEIYVPKNTVIKKFVLE